MEEGKKKVRLQEEIFSAWEGELRSLGLEGAPSLGRRKEAFLREISSFPPPRKGTAGELARRARRAGAVLVGDYHSLPRAQRSAGRILAALVREGASPILFLECFSRRDEKALSAWNRGKIGLDRLRCETRFDRTWGFPWEGYAEILTLARRLKVPVFPLEEDRHLRGLDRRERNMARRVKKVTRSRPGRLPFLLVGDLHLVWKGLPSRLETLGITPFRIFQNLETLYWELAKKEDLRSEAWLELDPRTWCLLETHPLWKLQSAFVWLEGAAFGGESGPDPDLSERALELAGALAEWLEISLPKNRAPLVFTGDPLSFLELLQGMEIPLPPDRSFLQEITASRIFLPPGRDLLYLAAPSLNTLAEGAARWLRGTLGERVRRSRPPRAGAFLKALLDHALGWTGSLLFNPYRLPTPRPPLPEGFWDHLDGTREGFRALDNLLRKMKKELRHLQARNLGERLGSALFAAVEKGNLSRSILGETFSAPAAGPQGTYRVLSRLVGAEGVRDGLGERLPPKTPASTLPRPSPTLLPED